MHCLQLLVHQGLLWRGVLLQETQLVQLHASMMHVPTPLLKGAPAAACSLIAVSLQREVPVGIVPLGLGY